MTTAPRSLRWVPRLTLLYLLYLALFVIGTLPLAGALPAGRTSQPGLLGPLAGFLVIGAVHVGMIAALVLASRWRGWKLAISLALAWYGAVTFLTQIETWYFLTTLSVDPSLLPALFRMGIPTSFVFVPAAVRLLGREGRAGAPPPRMPEARRTAGARIPGGGEHEQEGPAPARRAGRSVGGWIGRFAVVAAIYVVLYWTAGYFIAWQNPELRAFYGRPGEALPFLAHTAGTLRDDPRLLPFQLLRGVLWALCALPVILGSRLNLSKTALLVALFFSVPQNVVHLIANPLMPLASVRLSHLVETTLSNFVFGLVLTWILHPGRRSSDPAAGVAGHASALAPGAVS